MIAHIDVRVGHITVATLVGANSSPGLIQGVTVSGGGYSHPPLPSARYKSDFVTHMHCFTNNTIAGDGQDDQPGVSAE